LVYNGLNRLTSVTKTGISSESYLYDDDGRRIRKTVGATPTNWLYMGPDITSQYGSTWASPTAVVTHGPNIDDPIMRTTTTSQYYHQDGLGSAVAFTNPEGTLAASVRYDAFGNRGSTTGSMPLYGYTGREPDETGLIYHRARYYDPTLGRFTQPDPLGFAGGDINLYSYVGNNPVI
jgi:RHS repeat-associated protein